MKCGCGRDGRYVVNVNTPDEAYACNKYSRCPTYDELRLTVNKQQAVVDTCKWAIQRNLAKAGIKDVYALLEALEAIIALEQ